MLDLLEDKEFMQRMADHYSNKFSQAVDVAEVRNSIVRVAKAHATPERMKEVFLTDLLFIAESISKILLEKPWQVWAAPNAKEYVTSDNPLITMMPIRDDFAPGFGFSNTAVLAVFPLNPSNCLAMGTAGPGYKTINFALVDKVNTSIVLCMKEYAYSRTKLTQIETAVRDHGGDIKFGMNAFLLPGDALPSVKEFMLQWVKR